MIDISKVSWFTFLIGESELHCESKEDAEILKYVCQENSINCECGCTDWWGEPYYYVKRGSLITTCYTLEDDDICNCWTVKDYIENHMIENKENVIMSKRIIALEDTVELMTSSDYRERFVAEYEQLVIRYKGLRNMLDKWDRSELDFEPTCPRSTYNMQIKAMTDYIAVLEARAVIEGIEL